MFVVCTSRKTAFLVVIVYISCLVILLEGKSKSSCTCWRGYCDSLTQSCVCKDGWFGERCQFSRQRFTAESGVITDGPGIYEALSKCMWLIDSKRPNTSIELSIEQFATECSWDNLYVYDGSSVQAPLLAAYSGVLRDNSSTETLKSPIRTIRSSSNTLYICFYSDKLIKDNGFRIKYSVLTECSSSCSFHGNCNHLGKCICNPGWSGLACNISTCTYPCVHGTCNYTTLSCDCQPGYSGPSCNSTSNYGVWSKQTARNQDIIQGRASHAVGVLGDWLWVYGGYTLTQKPFNDLIRYSFSTNNWDIVSYASAHGPSRRYAHSLVVYNDSLLVFGGASLSGQTLNDLWHFNTVDIQWKRLSLHSSLPISVSGHTATLVNNKMIVIFGYGPLYGFTPYVQEFNLVTNQWTIYNYTLSIKGTYEHSSVYDPISGLIYVYAGINGETNSKISDALHSYDPIKHHWTKLHGSKLEQYSHSASLMGHLMLVYGGNTSPATIIVQSAKCFDSKFLAYDLICGQWKSLPKVNLPLASNGRLGQAGFIQDRKMYIFGGFNGEMMNDMLTYTLGDCSAWKNKTACLQAHSLSGCFWDSLSNHCLSPSEGYSNSVSFERPRCEKFCNTSKTCQQCNAQGLQCKWCGKKCKEKDDSCNTSQTCKFFPDPNCIGKYCQKLKCENHRTCETCVQTRIEFPFYSQCMWCEAKQRCVVGKSYLMSFPYGQCNQLVMDNKKCPAVKCSGHKTCTSCHKLSGCGWCDDGSGTGVGRCMDGGDNGPFSSENSIVPETCSNWYFMKCPACQCNGHSICNSKNKCLKCQHHTRGRHCQFCSVGFYGDPVNGGTCKACRCNKHAEKCDPVTSKCQCLVQGISGKYCEKCQNNHYMGNASNGGLCFYQLQINEPKTFNFSGKTSINFEFKPVMKEHDLEFEVAVLDGPYARINLTFFIKDLRSSKQKEKYILKGYRLGKLVKKFSQREFSFHKKYVNFRAYIYDIDKNAPVVIKAILSQPSALNIDLLEFFLTFFGCFLSLLCVASIGWRIRSRYHSYLVTRQNRAERDRMANRPFATVNLLLPNKIEIPTKSSPNTIAMEPLVKNKVAITTVVVLLPSGEDGLPPVGQCGICFASMLMSHGSHSHSGIRTRMGRKKNRKRATMTTYHI